MYQKVLICMGLCSRAHTNGYPAQPTGRAAFSLASYGGSSPPIAFTCKIGLPRGFFIILSVCSFGKALKWDPQVKHCPLVFLWKSLLNSSL